MTTYKAIGLMSGSSLDGLDIAYCTFQVADDHRILAWEIKQATTIPYTAAWQERLSTLPEASALTLAQTHVAFGELIGGMTRAFIDQHGLYPDFIASHGHTVFHFPRQKLSLQIGEGAAIAAATSCKVICDFRTQDMAFGGQGAPIAPTADRYLFGEYDCCLNLGGIANLSVKTPTTYVAFDICGANQILNALVKPLGLPYDDGGQLSATGQLLPALWEKAYQLDFFKQAYPKSLGNDWVKAEQVAPFLAFDGPVQDKLFTATKLIAQLIADHLEQVRKKEKHLDKPLKMLVTGGGAFNQFLISAIQEACGPHVLIELPSPMVIGFKESLLMALMGVLRVRQRVNCMANVTGAMQDSVNGALYEIASMNPTH
ncbi:MAG: anhydro-N-acetylmuramic acid kinase [Saprospiraceae bacterium]